MKDNFDVIASEEAPRQGSLLLSVTFALVVCLALSLSNGISEATDVGSRAYYIMENCLATLRSECRYRGFPVSSDLDPYGTGLVGEEFSPLTTTLGHVEDKRTSVNPLFASALAYEFSALGLKSGDSVAVGASGSFPGLLIAVLSACNAMELRPLLICSLGSSMYGANRIGFNVVDMIRVLRDERELAVDLLGFSLGGDGDRDDAPLFPEWRDAVLAEADRLGDGLILEDRLAESVKVRMDLYDRAAGDRGVRCFVGVGGSSVTFGDSDESASFPNGTTTRPFDSMPKDGLLPLYLDRGVPVMHLLCVKKLCDRWSIPYDGDPFSVRNP